MKIKVSEVWKPFVCVVLMVTNAQAKSGDIKTNGNISAITSSSLTVQGVNFLMTPSTECELSTGAHVSCAVFQVGNYVQVKWSGNHVVRELELISVLGGAASPAASITPGSGHNSDDNGHHSGSSGHSKSASKKELKFKASFGSDNSSVKPGGKVDYRVKKNEKRFVIKLKIPENSSPRITSAADAQALNISAQLSRNGIVYAVCMLKLDDGSPDMLADDVLQYEFKLDLRKKGGKTKFKKGSCDLDIDTAGVQQGIPSECEGLWRRPRRGISTPLN